MAGIRQRPFPPRSGERSSTYRVHIHVQGWQVIVLVLIDLQVIIHHGCRVSVLGKRCEELGVGVRRHENIARSAVDDTQRIGFERCGAIAKAQLEVEHPPAVCRECSY